jgi:DNA helicase-2/ATP-dependent DNA helicase PcrA
VDEYQDTNYIQAEIINILCEKHKNILVVGDDAQSIYSFRGARVDNILNFPDKFNGAKIFKLEINYRSTPQVLDLANDCLRNNMNQFEKNLKAVNKNGERPALVEVRDPYSQARFVTQGLGELIEEGKSLNDMAVLFRARYQSAELEMELVKRGISYVVRGGIRFFEQAHIKDVIAYMKIVSNPADETAWARALSMCPGIGPGYAAKIYDHFRETGRDIMAFIRSAEISAVVPAKARQGYKKFRKIVGAIIDPGGLVQPAEMIKRILGEGYETYLLAAFDNAKDRVDDLHELVNFAHSYTELNVFLADITLREDFTGDKFDTGETETETLVLSTIHQAKGLEWDTVMIIGVCEGQFPNPKAFSAGNDMEEERRLFYVAVTRARKYLYMIHPNMRYDYQQGTIIAKRSMFLDELSPDDYEVWQVGPVCARDEPDDYYDNDEYDEVIEL